MTCRRYRELIRCRFPILSDDDSVSYEGTWCVAATAGVGSAEGDGTGSASPYYWCGYSAAVDDVCAEGDAAGYCSGADLGDGSVWFDGYSGSSASYSADGDDDCTGGCSGCGGGSPG